MKMSLSHILEVNGQCRHFICCAMLCNKDFEFK